MMIIISMKFVDSYLHYASISLVYYSDYKNPLFKVLNLLPLKLILFCFVGIFVFLTIYLAFIVQHQSNAGYEPRLFKSKTSETRLADTRELDVRKDQQEFQIKKHVSFQPRGRTGNVLFGYAAMLGIAEFSSRFPVFPRVHYLRWLFHISAGNKEEVEIKNSKKISEQYPYAYDEKFELLDKETEDLIELNGYFHSWKYFDHVRDKIRSEFAFQSQLANAVEQTISLAIKKMFKNDTLRFDVILVGVHIRRKDLLTNESNESLNQGYTVAPVEYIMKGLEFYEQKFRTSKLLFLVSSDDESWARENVKFSLAPVYFLDRMADTTVFAVLASCNHSLITVGSFGWWAAWLAGGTTVYYKDFPRKNSSLSKNFVPQDYFYEGWIGL